MRVERLLLVGGVFPFTHGNSCDGSGVDIEWIDNLNYCAWYVAKIESTTDLATCLGSLGETYTESDPGTPRKSESLITAGTSCPGLYACAEGYYTSLKYEIQTVTDNCASQIDAWNGVGQMYRIRSACSATSSRLDDFEICISNAASVSASLCRPSAITPVWYPAAVTFALFGPDPLYMQSLITFSGVGPISGPGGSGEAGPPLVVESGNEVSSLGIASWMFDPRLEYIEMITGGVCFNSLSGMDALIRSNIDAIGLACFPDRNTESTMYSLACLEILREAIDVFNSANGNAIDIVTGETYMRCSAEDAAALNADLQPYVSVLTQAINGADVTDPTFLSQFGSSPCAGCVDQFAAAVSQEWAGSLQTSCGSVEIVHSDSCIAAMRTILINFRKCSSNDIDTFTVTVDSTTAPTTTTDSSTTITETASTTTTDSTTTTSDSTITTIDSTSTTTDAVTTSLASSISAMPTTTTVECSTSISECFVTSSTTTVTTVSGGESETGLNSCLAFALILMIF